MTGGEDRAVSLRRVAAVSGALLITLALLFMVYMVSQTTQARERAQLQERHAYDVSLLTRTLDATISNSEAALGRFVLDEQVATSGNIYYGEWRKARVQLNQLARLTNRDPEQRARVSELRELFDRRDTELARAARAAASQQGEGGVNLFYSAGLSPTGPALTAKLADIAEAERDKLTRSIETARFLSTRSDRLTDYLSWLGIIVAAIALMLGVSSYSTLRRYLASKEEAETQGERADELEVAVAERTAELVAANEALKAEAEERQLAEAQLRQVQKMEAVGQLTGGIAHDFNNMLAVVVGGLDLARRRIDGPRREVLVHLTNAMEGATRAAALTRRLLSFARSEPLMPERVDSTRLITAMRDLLDRTLGERIAIDLRLSDDAWPVFVDPHQFENALLNLAVNARDAMNGVGQLVIECENVTLEAGEIGDNLPGDHLRISVSDDGVGMSDEVRDRAFEPFFTTKEVGKGTGLGLSQIFGFVHQSGGDVDIDSTLGEGTTVSMYIPRAKVDAAHDTVKLHPVAASLSEEDDIVCTNARILLVEDDPRVRTATVGALEDLGYDPRSCGSAEEALDIFEPGAFDLVITDVIMPKMTGPELVRELKKLEPDVAILFVTGYAGDGEADELTGHEILRKPFTIGGLSSAVANALRASFTSRPPSEGAAAAG